MLRFLRILIRLFTAHGQLHGFVANGRIATGGQRHMLNAH